MQTPECPYDTLLKDTFFVCSRWLEERLETGVGSVTYDVIVNKMPDDKDLRNSASWKELKTNLTPDDRLVDEVAARLRG